VNFGIPRIEIEGTHSTAFVSALPGCDHPAPSSKTATTLSDTVSKNFRVRLRMGFDFIDEQNNNNSAARLDPSIPTSVLEFRE